MKGEILDTAYISYAIRSIGAIVLIFGLYKKNWISANSVKLAFIGGSIVTLVFVVLQKYNIFDFDKTYAAIISALIFITIGNLYSTYKYKQAKQ
jgi:peptidoglycan/LPS O-acetylase OafA/YrhL